MVIRQLKSFYLKQGITEGTRFPSRTLSFRGGEAGDLDQQWGREALSRAVGRWGHLLPPQHVPHKATYLHLYFFTHDPDTREQQFYLHSYSPRNFPYSLPLTHKLNPEHPSTLVSPGPLASMSKGKALALFPEGSPIRTGLVSGLPNGLPLYGVC